jgi:hypothetical protein
MDWLEDRLANVGNWRIVEVGCFEKTEETTIGLRGEDELAGRSHKSDL